MRTICLLFLLILLAGCGTPAASSSSPTATPVHTASSSAPPKHWKHAPPLTIVRTDSYTATLTTTDGSFTIQLLPKIAPLAVNSFVFLARHQFFNGIIFHRIIKGFMVQTGDPTGTGFGGPGYTFKDEKVTLPYSRGIVAMANSGPNTNGSQFFIVVAPKKAALQPNYTIFGRVIHGMNIVQKIADSPVEPSASNPQEVSQPVNPPAIKRVVIHQSA